MSGSDEESPRPQIRRQEIVHNPDIFVMPTESVIRQVLSGGRIPPMMGLPAVRHIPDTREIVDVVPQIYPLTYTLNTMSTAEMRAASVATLLPVPHPLFSQESQDETLSLLLSGSARLRQLQREHRNSSRPVWTAGVEDLQRQDADVLDSEKRRADEIKHALNWVSLISEGRRELQLKVSEIKHAVHWARLIIEGRREMLVKAITECKNKLHTDYYTQIVADGEKELQNKILSLSAAKKRLHRCKKSLREAEKKLAIAQGLSLDGQHLHRLASE